MSEPRFYVVELAGFNIHADIRPCRTAAPEIVCSVLDRAYCHREVARFKQGSGPHTRAARQERTRTAARERCAELNAWDASA